MVITVAHDYICPWCWIAIKQVEALQKEFDVTFEFVGYELFPEELEWPEMPAAPQATTNRPTTPSRLELAYAAAGMEPPPAIQPKKMRSHNALLASEYAKSVGQGPEFIRRMYEAYWVEGVEINALENIRSIAEGLVDSPEAMLDSIQSGEFEDRIVKFDDDAYAAGIYNVPTFIIGGERYAEQPLSVLAKAIRKELGD